MVYQMFTMVFQKNSFRCRSVAQIHNFCVRTVGNFPIIGRLYLDECTKK
jgi:hypothetical protein